MILLIKKITATLRFNNLDTIYVMDLADFLSDIDKSHKSIMAIISEPPCKIVHMHNFYYHGSTLKIGLGEESLLKILKINKKSPMEIQFVFQGVIALWALIQIIEKVYSWKSGHLESNTVLRAVNKKLIEENENLYKIISDLTFAAKRNNRDQPIRPTQIDIDFEGDR